MDTDKQVAAQAGMTPAELLRFAVEKGADVDRLSQLMALQQQWEANEARKAYVAAMTAFKAKPPTLTKNKQVDFTNKEGRRVQYAHATLDQVSAVIGKALSKHGISHHWETEQLQGGTIKVTCVLTHVKGHSERTPLEATADASGSKNSIQAIGSTITYLQRYSLLSATGMAVEGQDDDARVASSDAAGGMDEKKLADFLASLEAAASAEDLQKAFGPAWNAASDAKDMNAKRRLTEARDARRKELGSRK